MGPDRGDLWDVLVKSSAVRAGHFQYESGHHGDVWLDLDALFARPAVLAPFVAELSARLRGHPIDVVCGPCAGGAFLALAVAAKLGVEFAYAERVAPAEYRIPAGQHPRLRGRRVAVVDDAINAGSAVRATVAELRGCGATPVAVGALLVLGAGGSDLPLVALARRPSPLWSPDGCPLCAAGVPLGRPEI